MTFSAWVHGQNFFWGVIVAGGLYLPCLVYGYRKGMLTRADLARHLLTLPPVFLFGLWAAFQFDRGMAYGKIVATGTLPLIVACRVLNDCARHSMNERFISNFPAYVATLAGLAYVSALPVDLAFAHWVIGDISAVGGDRAQDGLLWAPLWAALFGAAIYGGVYWRYKSRRGMPHGQTAYRVLVKD